MSSTQLTVGGFTQPGVARGLIEMPANSEKGFSYRFLWFFPNPLFEKFSSLGEVDREFVQKISKYTMDAPSLNFSTPPLIYHPSQNMHINHESTLTLSCNHSAVLTFLVSFTV